MEPHEDSTCVIRMSGVSARGRHGVLPQERIDGQVFTVDITVSVGTPPRDDIAATLDYRTLAQCVIDRIEGEPVQLIETLAQDILSDLLRLDAVFWAKVRVHKPHAPLGVPFTDLSVEICGTNPQTPSSVPPALLQHPEMHPAADPYPTSCSTKKRGTDD